MGFGFLVFGSGDLFVSSQLVVPNRLVFFSKIARYPIEIKWRLTIVVVYALARGGKRVDALPSRRQQLGPLSSCFGSKVIVQYSGVRVHKYFAVIKRGRRGKRQG